MYFMFELFIKIMIEIRFRFLILDVVELVLLISCYVFNEM